MISNTSSVKVLFIGDIVGQEGVAYTSEILGDLIPKLKPDLVVANAENAVKGRGLTQRVAEQLYDAGVELITLGNHGFDQQGVDSLLNEDNRVIRPANYPKGTPGRGSTLCRVAGTDVLLINVMGRTFMQPLDCPFQLMDELLATHSATHIIVDMHAEATAEKLAMGWYLNGRVSAVIGTHTHVPTADERILPGGTAYVSDVGMVGPRDGILGMDRDAVIRRFRTQRPTKFEVAKGARQFCAVLLDLGEDGRANQITRIMQTES